MRNDVERNLYDTAVLVLFFYKAPFTLVQHLQCGLCSPVERAGCGRHQWKTVCVQER